MGTTRTRAGLLGMATAASLLAAACSGGAASSGLGVQDAGAQQACAGVQQLVAAASGGMGARQLRDSLGRIYTAAQTSENTVIKARALALYADAAVMATGGQAPSLQDDLQAMHQACGGQA